MGCGLVTLHAQAAAGGTGQTGVTLVKGWVSEALAPLVTAAAYVGGYADLACWDDLQGCPEPIWWGRGRGASAAAAAFTTSLPSSSSSSGGGVATTGTTTNLAAAGAAAAPAVCKPSEAAIAAAAAAAYHEAALARACRSWVLLGAVQGDLVPLAPAWVRILGATGTGEVFPGLHGQTLEAGRLL